MNNMQSSALAGRVPSAELEALRDGGAEATAGFSDTANDTLVPTLDRTEASIESLGPDEAAWSAPQRLGLSGISCVCGHNG